MFVDVSHPPTTKIEFKAMEVDHRLSNVPGSHKKKQEINQCAPPSPLPPQRQVSNDDVALN